MKELKVYVPQDGPYGLEPEEGGEPVEEETCYLKSDVDAVIAGLEQKLEDNVDFWKKKLDDEMASRRDEYEKSEKEIRRLKRALWIAHEYKAKFKRWWLHLELDYEASMIRPDAKTINRIKGKIGNCEKSERKCRAKAEEYK